MVGGWGFSTDVSGLYVTFEVIVLICSVTFGFKIAQLLLTVIIIFECSSTQQTALLYYSTVLYYTVLLSELGVDTFICSSSLSPGFLDCDTFTPQSLTNIRFFFYISTHFVDAA